MSYFVYIHICPNNKRYVGITRQNPKKRFGNGSGYKKNTHFSRAIKKYGWENIQHQVIEVDTESEMFYLEKYLIAFYNSNNPEFGYNHSLGGEKSSIGVKQTDDTKIKRRNSILDKYGTLINNGCFKSGQEPWNKGMKGCNGGFQKGCAFTDEHKRHLSLSHIGKKQSDECIKKRADAISSSMKGKKKPIYNYMNMDTGEIICMTASKARFINNIKKIY